MTAPTAPTSTRSRRSGTVNGSALEQEGVHKALREIAAELALVNVEFLGVEAGWAAGGAVPFKPPGGADVVAVSGVGEGEPEAAEEERALGFAEGSLVGPVPVAVAVFRKL